MLSTLPVLICLLSYYDRGKIVRVLLWQYWQHLRQCSKRPDALPCTSVRYEMSIFDNVFCACNPLGPLRTSWRGLARFSPSA